MYCVVVVPATFRHNYASVSQDFLSFLLQRVQLSYLN